MQVLKFHIDLFVVYITTTPPTYGHTDMCSSQTLHKASEGGFIWAYISRLEKHHMLALCEAEYLIQFKKQSDIFVRKLIWGEGFHGLGLCIF